MVTRSRRLAAAVLFAAALSGAMAAPAAAHDDEEEGGRGGSKTVEVVRTEVSWTMTSASCGQLPPGTTINGTGVLRDKITTETAPNGLITVAFDSVARGLATDQAGNRYRWNYDNESSATNSAAYPMVYRGWMIDGFELEGKGPIEVEAGFEADIIEDRLAGTFVISPRTQFGDPLDFGPPYVNRCDPL